MLAPSLRKTVSTCAMSLRTAGSARSWNRPRTRPRRGGAAELAIGSRLRRELPGTSVCGSLSSSPAIACSNRATSATQRAIGPGWSIEAANGTRPARLTRPKLGLHEGMPQYAAGRVVEPPVCEAMAPKHMPQATAAAEPLLLPPGVRSRFQGLRVGGGSKLAYCVVTVLPRKTAPAWRSFLTMVASSRAILLAQRLEPAAVGQSKTST